MYRFKDIVRAGLVLLGLFTFLSAFMTLHALSIAGIL